MHVLITGASGNVGSAVLRALADEPAVERITGLVRRPPSTPAAKTTWVAGDVQHADLAALCADADAVLHLAWLLQPARDEALTRAVNVAGSERVLAAALEAGVGTIVHTSSQAVYSPGSGPVGEEHPRRGIGSLFYSREKVAAEELLDRLESNASRTGARTRVVRLRPAPVLQRDAAAELRRYFLGPFFPGSLVRPGRLPVVPLPAALRLQLVHADDLADAFQRALVDETMRGAYNVAAEEVLDAAAVARAMGGRPLPLPAAPLRLLADLTFRLHLQPTPPGWLDLGTQMPTMDTARLRDHGWRPRHAPGDALREVLHGMADGDGGATPPLHADVGGRFRGRELRTGVGGRSIR